MTTAKTLSQIFEEFLADQKPRISHKTFLKYQSIIGLYKTEVIRRCGPWRHLEAVEFATLEWVHWFNHQRLLEPIGHVPPAELETHYYRSPNELAIAA